MTRATSSTQVGNRTAKWSTDGHETADVQVEIEMAIRVSGLTGVLLAALVLEYIDEKIDSRFSVVLHLSIPDRGICRSVFIIDVAKVPLLFCTHKRGTRRTTKGLAWSEDFPRMSSTASSPALLSRP
jgi:hypothetical protein